MTTINQENEQLEKLLHGMAGELIRCARSLGLSRQQIINVFASRLVTLGYEECGSTQAVAEWLGQLADNVRGGTIGGLLNFESIAFGERH